MAFGDIRGKLNESTGDDDIVRHFKRSHELTGQIPNKFGAFYNHKIHDHPDFASNITSKEHSNAIRKFTEGHFDHPQGSGAINSYLRNRTGEASSKGIHHSLKEGDVHKAVKTLSSAFTKEHTNKKPMATFGAVPPHTAKFMARKGHGGVTALGGFVSTSTDSAVAHKFSGMHYGTKGTDESPHHVVRYHLPEHTGLSAVHHSPHEENEVILHHGSKATYMGGKKIYHDGEAVHLHDVMVHPDTNPLEKYPPYKHPEKK